MTEAHGLNPDPCQGQRVQRDIGKLFHSFGAKAESPLVGIIKRALSEDTITWLLGAEQFHNVGRGP